MFKVVRTRFILGHGKTFMQQTAKTFYFTKAIKFFLWYLTSFNPPLSFCGSLAVYFANKCSCIFSLVVSLCSPLEVSRHRGGQKLFCETCFLFHDNSSLLINALFLTVEKFSEDAIDIEQHITIVPNPRAKRRGSMADYAFPELHSNRGKNRPAKEPENLLILTRTKTDRNGRRHSVAVPLIPPPDGEKFEGGYHVERNPITGGARLVPPPGRSSINISYYYYINSHIRF